MSEQVRVKLLQSGIASLRGMWTDVFRMSFVNFQIGNIAGYEPDSSDKQPRGSLTYIGDSSNIKVKLFNNDSAMRLSMIIPEDENNIDVGNVMLYSRYNGAIVPVVSIVLPDLVRKQNAATDTINLDYKLPSTRLIISLTVKHVELNDDDISLTIEVQAPEYANIPTFGSDVDVPDGPDNPWNQFIINQTNIMGGAPVLVTKDADDNYFASPLTQNLESPKYGVVGGPVHDERVYWLWGKTYAVPNELYSDKHVGAASYTDINLVTRGGSTY